MRWMLVGAVLFFCAGCAELVLGGVAVVVAGAYLKEPEWPAPERELRDPVSSKRGEVHGFKDVVLDRRMKEMEAELRGPIGGGSEEIRRYETGAFTHSSTHR